MENINKEQLLEVLEEYALLSEDVQNRANRKILSDWNAALKDFKKQLEADPELWKQINRLGTIQRLLTFNEYQHFEKIAFIDIASEEPVYEYDEKLHKDEKALYENWDQIQADYQKKLSALESAKLSPLASQRIQRLKKTFEEKSKKVKHYAYFADRMAEREQYVNHPETVTELQNSIKNTINPLATKYLAELLEKNPQLICLQPAKTDRHESAIVAQCLELKKALIHEHEMQSTYFKESEKDA